MDKFSISLFNTRHIEKYNAQLQDYTVQFENLENGLIENIELLSELITAVLEKIKENTTDDDRIKIYINHPELSYPISLPFIKKNDLTANMITNYISMVVQSNKKLALDNNLSFHASILKMTSGAGKRLNDFLAPKKTIVKVKDEDDSLCGLRAIVIGKTLADNDIETYNKMIRKANNLQTTEAILLANTLGLPFDKPIGLNEIQLVERHLEDYQLIVIDANCLNQIVYMGNRKSKTIVLYCHDNHYFLIKSLPSFYSCKHFCYTCNKAYSSMYEKHACNDVCKVCRNKKCDKQKSPIQCEFCYVYCVDEVCLASHIERVCGKVSKCRYCYKFSTFRHSCNSRWCRFCKSNVSEEHKCYILREDELKKKFKTFEGYLFFDYEAMHVDNVHVPNLVVVRKVCKNCLDNIDCVSNCKDFIFYDNESFCVWLFEQKDYIAIAHNLKGYDSYFLMQYIIKSLKPNEKLPEIILSGSKVLVIQFSGVKIIDSINFIPMSLSKLPKTFGIHELKKGYFPHYFNIPENQNYIGKYTDPSYYGNAYMSPSDHEKFEIWYNSKRNEIFDFKQELVDYCKSDVDILAKACLMFRKLFMDITKTTSDDLGVDPFQTCLTIASACHLVYRRNFMRRQVIALIPDFGYQKSEPSSYKAFTWLKYLSIKANIYIQHAKNGQEKKIGNFKLDGWDELNKCAYEFHGCLYHGCPKCYNPDSYNAVLNETMRTTYNRHLERINYLKSQVNLIELWECDYDKMIKNDEFFKQFAKSQRTIRPPLKPRDALSGGRTNSIVLHYKGSIGYIDFTSLYPYVQKYGVFPIDHPTIITENFKDINEYFGLIYCRVLPPQNLYIPVLPYHVNGKLLFPLCAACAECLQQRCDHLPHEREIEGTWVILELIEAIKRGYTVTQIYEVWHFEQKEQYDANLKSGGLFTGYVNAFLKLKQEAAGFPRWVKTEEDKQKYVDDFFRHEGIQLDICNIKENHGLKAVSKLMLNSQWGRYAMQTHKTQSKFVTSIHELTSFFQNDQFEVTDLLFPTNDVACIYYTDKKEMHWGSNQTNVVLAAFVTCQARLKLFFELEKLGDRVLYFDTDSIIYKKIPGLYEPKIGDYLGEFTNEIDPSEGNEIIEFVSCGPKNYSYKLDTGVTHCKVKGFTLNYTASKLIDFDRMKRIVLEDNSITTEVEQKMIVRNKKEWSLKTKTQSKIYRLVYDKRVIQDDLTTLPYGYKI